ncbi:MAG: hypothetical protein IJV15_15370 [Lachnospiraceae bacterium]|nr:hypothetical protein [Lachnospiraceae bacterium]
MRIKKFIAKALCATMLLTGSGFAGINSSAEEFQDAGVTEQTDNNDDLVQASPTAQENKVVIVSWNDEVENVFNLMFESHPDLKKKAQFIEIDKWAEGVNYNEEIQKLVKNSKNNTIIFATEIDDLKNLDKLSDAYGSDVPTPLADIGFNADAYKKSAYKYLYDICEFDNKLYFASWQACPGYILYRKDIAKDVFGTDDAAEVQEQLKDWDSFYDAAVAVDKKGYSILSGPDELGIVNNVVYDVYDYLYNDEKLEDILNYYKEEEGVEYSKDAIEFMKYAKKIAPYTNGHEAWSDEWAEDMKGDVFAWFSTTWMDGMIMDGNDKQFGICNGPEGFFYGGTFLGVYDNGGCEAEAAEMLNLLCTDYEVDKTLVEEFGTMVNNTDVIEDFVASGDSAGFEYESVDNPLKLMHIASLAAGGEEYVEPEKPENPEKPEKPENPENPVVTVEMYRLYNPNSGEHFYTANETEKNNLVGYGWRYEGVGWNAPEKSDSPVYRLYNPNAGDHHYTLSKEESDHLVSLGWKYEGIGWYSDDAKSVPLYRQYNPNAKAGSHNFTVSKDENDWLVGLGWREEGIGWYGAK